MKAPRLTEGEDPAAIVSFEMEQMILPRLSGPHVPQVSAPATSRPGLSRDGAHRRHDAASRLEELPLPYEDVAVSVGGSRTRSTTLHRQNVVHLDIKPSNVMFRGDGDAVLIDYGLSHHTQLPDLMEEEFRLPYGTAPYMAPEQLMGVRDDPRSDLFSLGVMLYFFTTGERPFGDRETMHGLRRRFGAIPSAAPTANRIIRHGCRRSCCAAWRSSRSAPSDRGAARLRPASSRSGQAHRAPGGRSAIRSPRSGAAASTAAASRRSRNPMSPAQRPPARSSWSHIDLDEGAEALQEALRDHRRAGAGDAAAARLRA